MPTVSLEDHQQILRTTQMVDSDFIIQKSLEKLMLSWATVCTQQLGRTNCVKHRITTIDEIPVRKRAYKISLEKHQFIESQVQELLEKQIIRPSISPWAAPVVVVVPKKDGSSRFCVDYWGLNAKTHQDAYPMPQIQEIVESLHGATVFRTLD